MPASSSCVSCRSLIVHRLRPTNETLKPFPQSVLNKMKVVKGLSVSLVGRNLWTILKHTDNIDPESAYNNTNGQGLELNGYPATRNVGFNVNVKF